MTTRREFLQSLPVTGAAFAVAGHLAMDEPAHAQPAAPRAPGHFHPKGKAPSRHTLEVLRRAKRELPFGDRRDFEENRRGLIAPMKELKIMADAGHVAWDMERYQFFNERDDFDTVHPSLTRISQLNMNYGLYKVTDDIYQVRGLDLSDLTIVRGRTGWILFDVMLSRETARAAWELFQEHVGGGLPVTAVIYSHSHTDHWGGVRGIVDQADVRAGKIEIIAPRNFMEHTISENVYAGNAMNRRLFFQYGILLPASPYGHAGQGLGMNAANGAVELIPPTRIIEDHIEYITVDGVPMVFQNTPNTEAPTEMNTYLPEAKALWMAENVNALLHNIYTLRGAPVRNALRWSSYLNEALYMFGQEAEVLFHSHHWPRWGNDRIQEVLRAQRDLYANMNNQSLHHANQGVTINQIHNVYKMPESLQQTWYARGYHGSPEHNSRGVVQRFLGYWDCNPATLVPLSPEDSAPLYVEMMGGASRIMAKGRELHDRGDYLLAQEILNRLVHAEPGNQGRQGPPRRRVGAARLPAGEPGPAQQLSLGRLRAAFGDPGWGRPFHGRPRRDPGDVHRALPELPGHPDGLAQGRGHGIHDQPHHARQRREVRGRAEQRDADEHRGLPRRRSRPDADHQPVGPGADDDGRQDARGPDRLRRLQGRGRPIHPRPARRHDGRFRSAVRGPARDEVSGPGRPGEPLRGRAGRADRGVGHVSGGSSGARSGVWRLTPAPPTRGAPRGPRRASPA
jgi:alkyl sulfatase BDS1-like metallo-beta-lactamase superfamily hydrolase